MLSVAGAAGCTKEKIVVETRGAQVAELQVTAEAGSCSVAVETDGGWSVGEAGGAGWVRFDVAGGSGNGAFTLYWDSNESDAVELKMNRMARIVVRSTDRFRADTICLKQAGTPVVLAFGEQRTEAAAALTSCSVRFSTNIPRFEERLAAQSDAAWIGSVGIDPLLSACTFVVAANDTGRSRSGSVSLRFVDAWGDPYTATLTVTQKP